MKLYNRFLKRWTSVSRCLRARERTSETFSATSCLSVSPLDCPQIGYGSLPLSRNIYTDLGSALHCRTCSNKSAFTRILAEFQDHCNIHFLVFCSWFIINMYTAIQFHRYFMKLVSLLFLMALIVVEIILSFFYICKQCLVCIKKPTFL